MGWRFFVPDFPVPTLLERYDGFELTPDQRVAVDEIAVFLEEPGPNVFMLKGYAGTGKTTLVKCIADHWADGDVGIVLLLAPTGRAARVLEAKAGRKAATIHSLLYKLADKQAEPSGRGGSQASGGQDAANAPNLFEETSFVAFPRPVSAKPLLLIVDEASMVSDREAGKDELQFGSGRLLQDLLDYARPVGNDKGAKILFIGDPGQLPPVKMDKSPALDGGYLLEAFGVKSKEFVLRDIVRQDVTSALGAAVMTLRMQMETGLFQPPQIEANGRDIKSFSEDKLVDIFQHTPGSKVVIANANKTVLRNNQKIRLALFGEDSKREEPLVSDQMLVVSNNAMTGLLNGDRIVFRAALDGQYDADVVVNLFSGDRKEVTLRYRRGVFEEEPTDALAPGQKARFFTAWYLLNGLSSPEASMSYEERVAVQVDFKQRIEKAKKRRAYSFSGEGSTLGIGPRELLRSTFYEAVGDSVEMPDNLKDSEEYEGFVEPFGPGEVALRDPFRNALMLKYGYAVTCHKAQGGEWDSAFVIWDYPRDKRNSEEFLRWAYTAITRARTTLFSVGSLFSRY